jgi:hypothetical protein
VWRVARPPIVNWLGASLRNVFKEWSFSGSLLCLLLCHFRQSPWRDSFWELALLTTSPASRDHTPSYPEVRQSVLVTKWDLNGTRSPKAVVCFMLSRLLGGRSPRSCIQISYLGHLPYSEGGNLKWTLDPSPHISVFTCKTTGAFFLRLL